MLKGLFCSLHYTVPSDVGVWQLKAARTVHMHPKAGVLSEKLTQRFLKICLDFSGICSTERQWYKSDSCSVCCGQSTAWSWLPAMYHLPAAFLSSLVLNTLAVPWREQQLSQRLAIHLELAGKSKMMSVV